MNTVFERVGAPAKNAAIARPARRSGVIVTTAVAVAALTGGATPHATFGAVSAAPVLPGTWQPLPAAPIVPFDSRLVSVWTGREVVVFDRVLQNASDPDLQSTNAAAAFNPVTGVWRPLTPPPRPGGNYEGSYVGAWTGKEVLIGGPLANLAYNPTTNRWRKLPVSLGGPMSVWTGRAMISWGGGCCGDASADGLAYNPARNTGRKLPASPLAPAQRPVGVWTGREVMIFVSGLDPNRKTYPASMARAAAYNPSTNRWRRIAPVPVAWGNPQAVWDGHRVLLVGAGARGKATLAYNPTTNSWRSRAVMPSRLASPFAIPPQVVWTGKRLMLWRGRDGLAYNPTTYRWTRLPQWPLASHSDITIAWTGRKLFVWGFNANSTPPSSGKGAMFAPVVP